MRIISGKFKGRKLNSIDIKGIRPSSDKLREAIYNILQFKISGSVVLELFAGTGALGIEGLSRGAESAVFIDNYSTSLIKKNIITCGIDNRKAKIIKWNIAKDLNCIKTDEPVFDLVFIDPPYNTGMLNSTLLNLAATNSLVNEACVVVEHAVAEKIPEDTYEYKIFDQRKYGKKHLSFLNYKP